MADLNFYLPEKHTWSTMRKVITAVYPEATSLEDYFWTVILESLVSDFEKERISSIRSVTGWIDRDSWETSQRSPGMTQELFFWYDWNTNELASELRADLGAILAVRIGRLEEKDWAMDDNTFLRELNVAIQDAYDNSIAKLRIAINRIVGFQESYYRPFVRPYAIMVFCYNFLNDLTGNVLGQAVGSAIAKIGRTAQGGPFAGLFRGLYYGAHAVNALIRPIYYAKEALKLLARNLPDFVKWISRGAIKMWANNSTVGVVTAIAPWAAWVGLAALSGIAGFLLSEGVIAVLRKLDIEPSWLETAEKKMEEAREQAQQRNDFDEARFSLAVRSGQVVGNELAQLILQSDMLLSELEGETDPIGPVRLLSERIKTHMDRVSAFAPKDLPDGVDITFLTDLLLSKLNDMLIEAKLKEDETLGASILSAGTAPTSASELFVEINICWNIIELELLEMVTDETSEEDAKEIVNALITKNRESIEDAYYDEFMKKGALIFGDSEQRAITLVAQKAQQLMSLVNAQDVIAANYDNIAGAVEALRDRITDAEALATIDEIIAVVMEISAAIREADIRQRAIDAGGKNEESLTQSPSPVAGGGS